MLFSEVLALEMVDTAGGDIKSKVLQLRLSQSFHLLSQLSSLEITWDTKELKVQNQEFINIEQRVVQDIKAAIIIRT